MSHSRIAVICISLLAIVSIAGCRRKAAWAQGQMPAKYPSEISVQTLPDENLELPAPTVQFSRGVMTVSGSVLRKPAARTRIDGRIDIEVLNTTGMRQAWIPALLTPTPIPFGQYGEAGYEVHYGWIPPVGSIVRVRFVDRDTATMEDATNGGMSKHNDERDQSHDSGG